MKRKDEDHRVVYSFTRHILNTSTSYTVTGAGVLGAGLPSGRLTGPLQCNLMEVTMEPSPGGDVGAQGGHVSWHVGTGKSCRKK